MDPDERLARIKALREQAEEQARKENRSDALVIGAIVLMALLAWWALGAIL